MANETVRLVEEKLDKLSRSCRITGLFSRLSAQAYELLDRPEQAIEFYRPIAADEKATAGLRADIDRLGRNIGKL